MEYQKHFCGRQVQDGGIGRHELAPFQEHLECAPIFRASLPERWLWANWTASAQQATDRPHREGWETKTALQELREQPGLDKLVSAIVHAALHMDSWQELHPGPLMTLQGAVAHPQPLLLELDQAETGRRHSMHTNGPSSWDWSSGMGGCRFEDPLGCMWCFPSWRKGIASKMLQYPPAGLPCPEQVRYYYCVLMWGFPTWTEGWASTMLEYLSAGLPLTEKMWRLWGATMC